MFNCKDIGSGEFTAGTCVQDMERGVMPGINPLPWQTCTSIGDWFYNRNWTYRPTSWVIHMLADIVSKNGNLLLNVVQRPDGSLDPQAETILAELADWMAVNGEAIHGIRPWQVYGEGRTRAGGGHFQENMAYSARDIRFITTAEALYAIALGTPTSGSLRIASLARPAAGGNVIRRIRLLGAAGDLAFTQDGTALVVTLPADTPRRPALTLRIEGDGLVAVPVPDVPPAPVVPGPEGQVRLLPEDAVLVGKDLRIEAHDDQENLGYWADPAAFVRWTIRLPAAGTYAVTGVVATTHTAGPVAVTLDGTRAVAVPSTTGGWQEYRPVDFGTVTALGGGDRVVTIGAVPGQAWAPINLRSLTLTPRP